MDSLLYTDMDHKKRSYDLRTSLCYYISIILVLVAFICSMFSLGFCSAVGERHSSNCLVENPGENLQLRVPYLG